MDSEAQENKTNYCYECLHFVGNGDRCDKTQAVCYIGSPACSRYFTETREKYNYTNGKVRL